MTHATIIASLKALKELTEIALTAENLANVEEALTEKCHENLPPPIKR